MDLFFRVCGYESQQWLFMVAARFGPTTEAQS